MRDAARTALLELALREPTLALIRRVLTGRAGVQVAAMDQAVRDAVGTTLLELTLRELFVWRFMQTDPNWGNFLFDAPSGRLHLIDFGASHGPCRLLEGLHFRHKSHRELLELYKAVHALAGMWRWQYQLLATSMTH